MPSPTPPDKVLAAARVFAREKFAGQHRYAMVLHTDQQNPHVHLVVKAEEINGHGLYIDKPMLRAWREDFARAMRQQGIAANPTPLMTRESQTSHHSPGRLMPNRCRGRLNGRDGSTATTAREFGSIEPVPAPTFRTDAQPSIALSIAAATLGSLCHRPEVARSASLNSGANRMGCWFARSAFRAGNADGDQRRLHPGWRRQESRSLCQADYRIDPETYVGTRRSTASGAELVIFQRERAFDYPARFLNIPGL